MCSKLYIAAFEGYTNRVIALLDGNGCSSLEEKEQSTANHHGRACSIHEVTADCSTLLHIAAAEGHESLIAELCRRDTTLLSAASSSGDTPLHCAARAGHAGAVRAIARLARASDGVAEEDRLEMVLHGRNEAGDTALHVAARHRHGEAAEALVAVAGPEMAVAEVNGAGVSALYLAVISGSVQMVSLLLHWKPGLATDLDINRSSPLHFASSDGDCSIIKAILAHSPPKVAHIQDDQGLSPLHAAALMGHAGAVRLLLQFSPASADVRDKYGRSFVHIAAMKGHSSVVSHAVESRMLEHHLNSQDREGNTPLHLAVVAGECNIVSKLLSSGKVQTHIMNNAGCTPSDLVKHCRDFYSLVMLLYCTSLGKNFNLEAPLK
uniref:Uncharacterized protein n=1 Tax=Leersia perrieri TaxID=77586 RepID=A0A0D9XRQ9_9ORYZ